MKLNEVASLLRLSREQAETAIVDGVALPVTKAIVKLPASKLEGGYDIAEEDLDYFIAKFEAEEPGRHPPAAVRRELQVEARHRCAICVDAAPLQFHHMIDWAKVNHHDPKRMIAVCGTCHDRCTKGEIDYKSQLQYKSRLFSLDRRYIVDSSPNPGKRQSDLKQLSELCDELHTGVLNAFFSDASRDVVPDQIFYFYEGFHAAMGSMTLFFHDKTLLELWCQFDKAWARSMSYGPCFRPMPSGRGFRFSLEFCDMAERQRQYSAFHADLADAEAAFRLLYEYIREEYPELDFSATDRKAWEANRKFLEDKAT